MSVFSSFFSRDPSSTFSYEVGAQVISEPSRSLWTLYSGKKRGTGELVSIFKCDLGGLDPGLADRARAGLKRLKTVRHPCIVTYLDSIETDKQIIIATEYAKPLEAYLSDLPDDTENDTHCNKRRESAIAWGLHQVSTGLQFLNSDCNLIHSAICSSSVFVDKAGVWKIANLDYVFPSSERSTGLNLIRPHGLKELQPPHGAQGGNNRLGASEIDSFGFGILVWEIFNGKLNDIKSLKTTRNIPESLLELYPKLVDSDAKKRISHQDFVLRSKQAGGFLSGPFIDAMLFLEQIQIKEQGEKNRFLTNLDKHLDMFPRDICKNKILPLLIETFEYGNVGSAILGPLFKVGSFLDGEEYAKKMLPCVVKLFECQDRAVRTRLLEQMDLYISHLTSAVVNDQLFKHYAEGFVDSNPIIRELTVKCLLNLAPKLNHHNLNEETLKHFARLQARDEEGGIRTNTTICLGKIAHHLDPAIRQSSLILAFLRVMRDPFPPARIAAIMALSATQNFYPVNDCSTKIMPALCHLTSDPEKSVRDVAFKSLKGFLSKMEKVFEDPSLVAQMESDVNAAGSTVNGTVASGWAGWAVSSLASKFYKSKLPQTSSAAAPVGTMGSASTNSNATDVQLTVKTVPTNQSNDTAISLSNLPSPSGSDSKWDLDNMSTISSGSSATNASSKGGARGSGSRAMSLSSNTNKKVTSDVDLDGWALEDDSKVPVDGDGDTTSKKEKDEVFLKFQPDKPKQIINKSNLRDNNTKKSGDDFFAELGVNDDTNRPRRAGRAGKPMKLGARKMN